MLLILTIIQITGASIQNKRINTLRETDKRLTVELEIERVRVEKLSLELTWQFEQLRLSAAGSVPIGNPELDAINIADINDGLCSYSDQIQMASVPDDRPSSPSEESACNVAAKGERADVAKLLSGI